MNEVWAVIRRKAGSAFEGILQDQRAWLRLRESEAEAATRRYEGGSMSAWTGWARYVEMSADRLARLHEIAGDL